MSRTLRALLTAALLFGLLAATANAQDPPAPLPDPKVVPIQVTGPPAQRLNFIIMGDGYQKDQQELFRRDLDRNLAVMWATEPFRTYRNYINVYAVELASIDYGVRCDPDGRVRAADGTVRDTGVREGPIDGKHTALRMISRTAAPIRSPRGTVYGGAPLNCAADAPVLPRRREPVRDGQPGAQPHHRQLRRAGAGHPAHVAEPADARDLQHLHLRRHRRQPGDHLGWLAAGPADLAARDRPLARHARRRVPVLLA